MFEPAWKKEDPKSEAKALKEMDRMSVSKLKQVVLEAPLDSVKYAAVIALGKDINDESAEALKEIKEECPSDHLKALSELQLRFCGDDLTSRDWFNASDRINSALYYKEINIDDVLAVMTNVRSHINTALLFRSLFWSSDWRNTSNEKAIEVLHQVLNDLFDKGIPLSILLEWMRQKGQEKLFTAEESNRLKTIYDENNTSFYFDSRDRFHPHIRDVYSALIRIWAYYGDEMSKEILKLEPFFNLVDEDHIDVRSKKAALIDEKAREYMNKLNMKAEDISDLALFKARKYDYRLPLKYLYENGKKEFIEKNYRKTTLRKEKEYDPEDDCYYINEEIIVNYGKPEDPYFEEEDE
ncbi:MAG: hypothetical protein IJI66_10795 [Erysipelotrichaceae bacterium]|nr:hypothetical protein [Erysipelotrichaceae bacterium]